SMVLLGRKMPELFVAASHRQWRTPHPLGLELAGRRVGIIGYGNTGRALARLCAAAGMSVWGLRRRVHRGPSDAAERALPAHRLDELLGTSASVVTAASLNPATRGLLGPSQFATMRPGAFLVNVARGALVDERALADALRSGRLGGAALDVAEVEPLPERSDLWDAPNLW